MQPAPRTSPRGSDLLPLSSRYTAGGGGGGGESPRDDAYGNQNRAGGAYDGQARGQAHVETHVEAHDETRDETRDDARDDASLASHTPSHVALALALRVRDLETTLAESQAQVNRLERENRSLRERGIGAAAAVTAATAGADDNNDDHGSDDTGPRRKRRRVQPPRRLDESAAVAAAATGAAEPSTPRLTLASDTQSSSPMTARHGMPPLPLPAIMIGAEASSLPQLSKGAAVQQEAFAAARVSSESPPDWLKPHTMFDGEEAEGSQTRWNLFYSPGSLEGVSFHPPV
jgi:hypothetical protein